MERVFDRPFTDEKAVELRRRAGACFEMRHVRLVRTLVSRDRLRGICIYEAPDAASVRDAHDLEDIPYARMWSAVDPLGADQG